jgi:prepilin-type N-terminal cleavage/methylation domain-containing protein
MPRRGLTLLELLAAITLIGMLAAIAAPRLVAIVDMAALRTARLDLLAALDAARGTAHRLGDSVELRDDGVRRTVVPLAPPDTLPVWSGPVALARGVSQSGFGRAITFGPAGLATGASNRTITLTRGQATVRVVISRLGRVR